MTIFSKKLNLTDKMIEEERDYDKIKAWKRLLNVELSAFTIHYGSCETAPDNIKRVKKSLELLHKICEERLSERDEKAEKERYKLSMFFMEAAKEKLFGFLYRCILKEANQRMKLEKLNIRKGEA